MAVGGALGLIGGTVGRIRQDLSYGWRRRSVVGPRLDLPPYFRPVLSDGSTLCQFINLPIEAEFF